MARIPPDVKPGIYRLNRVGFFTYGGKHFTRRGEELGQVASIRIEVVPEPDEKPAVEGLDVL